MAVIIPNNCVNQVLFLLFFYNFHGLWHAILEKSDPRKVLRYTWSHKVHVLCWYRRSAQDSSQYLMHSSLSVNFSISICEATAILWDERGGTEGERRSLAFIATCTTIINNVTVAKSLHFNIIHSSCATLKIFLFFYIWNLIPYIYIYIYIYNF